MFVKAGLGRRDLHLKTVQQANKQMQFQEQDQEEETLLDQYQIRSRWITRPHKSGNLWEEEMSTSQYQMLGVTGSTVS